MGLLQAFTDDPWRAHSMSYVHQEQELRNSCVRVSEIVAQMMRREYKQVCDGAASVGSNIADPHHEFRSERNNRLT